MTRQTGAEGAREGLFAGLKGLLATLLASGRSRLSLLATEIEEEKLRLIDLLVSAVAALFLLSLGIVLLVVFLAVAYWEQRVAVLGIATGLVLLTGTVFFLRLLALAKRPTAIFQSSLKEIDKDLEALRERT